MTDKNCTDKPDQPENVYDFSSIVEKRMVDNQEEFESKRPFKKSPISKNEIRKALSSNEVGDARIFKQLFKNKFVYDHILGAWYYWNEHYWRKDYLENALSSVNDVVDKVYFIELSNLLIEIVRHIY